MAVIRAKECGPPSGLRLKYPHPHKHKSGLLMCGIPSCLKPGLVWLNDAEQAEYDRGQRTFQVSGIRGGVNIR
jgi:hypothetical protein